MSLTRHTQPQITNVNNDNIAGNPGDMDADLREKMLGVIVWKVRRYYRLISIVSGILGFLYMWMYMGIGWAICYAVMTAVIYAIGVCLYVYILVGRITQLLLWLRAWKNGRLVNKF